jgi:predicted lipoprotein with Yx(FWY)xxD motif
MAECHDRRSEMRAIPSPATVGRLANLVAAVLLVAACTDGSGSDVRSVAPTGSLTPATSAEASASSSEGGYTRGDYADEASAATGPSAGAGSYVVNAASAAIGAYLTGENGRTLYTFKADGPNTTSCTGGCATTWPPFIVGTGGSVTAGAGVTGSLTTVGRPDGQMQVTYNGARLYYFANDAKAGDTNGQGVGGKWFVAAP